MHHQLPLACAFCLVVAACFTPAKDRVFQDEAVGSKETAEYSVQVEQGLAVIREASPSRLVLWQSAPSITAVLTRRGNRSDNGGSLTIQIRNSMLDAQVVVDPPEALEEQVTTGKTVELRVSFAAVRTEPGEITLRLTPPDSDRPSFRFALMSDVQEAIDHVEDLYRRINDERDLDFLLGAGDLTERGTRQELQLFEDKLNTLNIPYYATLGNHELGVDPCLYHEVFGRGSYSFEHRGARFTLLDSASATLDPTVYEWLQSWLQLGREQFHVVAMHIPPIDPVGVRNGSFASRTEAHKFLQRVGEGLVDLTLYGHIHSFYDFSNAAIPAVISGGGGAIPERFDDVGRHFVVFEVNPERGTFEHALVAIEPD